RSSSLSPGRLARERKERSKYVRSRRSTMLEWFVNQPSRSWYALSVAAQNEASYRAATARERWSVYVNGLISLIPTLKGRRPEGHSGHAASAASDTFSMSR